jgi:uncharacterized membrane protein
MVLVMYWQVRKHPLVAGLLLGLAAATRQQAWLFLPFLLYLGWREGRWQDLRYRALAALAMFLACNVPFMLQNPGDWLSGVLAPVLDPLFAQGVGLVGLTAVLLQQQLGPPILYVALVIAAYIFACKLFLRRCLASPGLAMLLPILPLALGWCSPRTFFVILPLLAMAVLTSLDQADGVRTGLDRRISRLGGV